MTIHTKMLRDLEDSQGERLILDDVMEMAAYWFRDSISELEDETDEDSKKAVENYKEALILIDNFRFLTGF
jgi:hypothetical protein